MRKTQVAYRRQARRSSARRERRCRHACSGSLHARSARVSDRHPLAVRGRVGRRPWPRWSRVGGRAERVARRRVLRTGRAARDAWRRVPRWARVAAGRGGGRSRRDGRRGWPSGPGRRPPISTSTPPSRSPLVFAAGRSLRPGVAIQAVGESLDRLQLPGSLAEPGAARRVPPRARSLGDPSARPEDVPRPAMRVRVDVRGARIVEVTDLSGDARPCPSAELEPELLTGVGETGLGAPAPAGARRDVAIHPAAVLAAEDHRFFDHGGLDLLAVGRALVVNASRGEITQGASTLTQQLVKNLALGPERTWRRKIREGVLALALERRYPKEKILEAYLNTVYLGQRGRAAILGVGAAAQSYWGKDARHLGLAESALLAGMIRAPNRYSPAEHPERARAAARCRAAPDARARNDRRRDARGGSGGADGRARGRRRSFAGALLPRLRARGDPRAPGRGQPADLHDARSGAPACGGSRRRPRPGPPGDRAPPPSPLSVRREDPGRPGGSGPGHGRGASPGRGPGLRGFCVQPRDPRPPAARVRVQAVRLPGRAPARSGRAAAGGDCRFGGRGPAHRGGNLAGGLEPP